MNGATVSVACPLTGTMSFSNTLTTTPLTPVTATAITGVWPTSDSTLAFVTYTGSGGVLPAYAPSASGQGTTTYIKLSGAATAPIAGVVSADNSTFYAATSGDNLVHLITRGTLTDSSTAGAQSDHPRRRHCAGQSDGAEAAQDNLERSPRPAVARSPAKRPAPRQAAQTSSIL